MTHEETINKMHQMKFYAMARSFRERLADPQHQDLTHEEIVGLLIDDEWIDRENKKLKRRLVQAKFKVPATLEAIDYQLSRGLVKKKILELATLSWITHHQNLIIIGPTGIGKSFIAQAFGHTSCHKGYSAHYLRLSRLLHQLYLARADGSYARLLMKLAKYDLLIIDDWGVTSLKEQEAQDLLEVIEDRYELKATIITSQLPIEHWHEFIGDQTIADAICDRLVHNAYKIKLAGESVRKIRGRKKNNAPESLTNDDL